MLLYVCCLNATTFEGPKTGNKYGQLHALCIKPLLSSPFASAALHPLHTWLASPEAPLPCPSCSSAKRVPLNLTTVMITISKMAPQVNYKDNFRSCKLKAVQRFSVLLAARPERCYRARGRQNSILSTDDGSPRLSVLPPPHRLGVPQGE